MPRIGGNKSAIIVGELLSTEGFSPHVASQVKRYALKNARTDQRKRYVEVKREFSEIMQRLTKGERMIVGAYIKILNGMSFDTALKIGLTVYAVECDKARTAPHPSGGDDADRRSARLRASGSADLADRPGEAKP